MQDIHYACNNTQVCKKRVLPDAECKKEGCKFCVETETKEEQNTGCKLVFVSYRIEEKTDV